MSRPISVTIVAWFVIALNLLSGIIILAAFLKSPNPDYQFAFGCLGSVVAIVCGFFMLKGKNWSRWLYIAWCAAGLAFALATVEPLMLVPGAVKTLIIAFFLFRSSANAYFRGPTTTAAGL